MKHLYKFFRILNNLSMHEIFIKIFIKHFSLRLFFPNVAIETNDGFIVLDINFSAIFFNYRNQKKVFKNRN